MSGRPDITGWARVGCFTYLVLGLLWCVGNVFVRMMGPCPAFSSNASCEWSRGYELWLFPGSQIVIVGIGYALFRWAAGERQ